MRKSSLGLALLALAVALCLFACGNDGQTQEAIPSTNTGRIPLPQMEPDEPYGVVEEKGIPIVRPDDPEQLKLYVNVVRPASDERFPTLLIATAYRKEFLRTLAFDSLVSNGYAIVVLDVLGSGSSEGGCGGAEG